MRVSPIQRRSGFTLLEVVLAVGLIAMLIGMVFTLTRASLALGQTVVDTQNEEMLQQAFFELLGKRFSSLPGNARFDLRYEQSGGQVVSDLTIQKVPLSFTWGGQPRVAKAVQLSTVRRRSGFLSVVLRYYENEILEDSEAPTNGTSTLSTEPFAEIELLSDLAYFEWRVLDGRDPSEWLNEWDIQGRMPLQIELLMAFGARGGEIRHVFWISPKQNPEVVLRQNLQNQTNQGTTTIPGGGVGGGGTGGGGGGGRPGGGGNINIPIGPVTPGGGGSRPGR